MIASVLDIVDNEQKSCIIDVSAECHMPDTILMPYRPKIRGESQNGKFSYRFGGATCLAGEIVDCNGRSVFTPYSSSGNVAIGFGNYNDRTGKSTNIYGDKIKVTANEDITFANRIIVPGGEDGGIRFANDDTITFDDTDNIYTFKHDTSTGDTYKKRRIPWASP